ncbi:MAG: sodium-translocating pyrophosphatase [Deltaproteobacteria bacterium RIFCSPLOWO2_12_FULL_44_12]|nr:MAG: sodium-translocating pyrophosphatase [Deltaproteobacteria bacterium RIFCSPHIGHO2_01_FULL_43_49]OGQ16186.1 MAG: sodium-translocating pyrophosphatase [Deltaproteobacteria bacterium RIFCSPHIGHO2_02_FULL_44_53]OGQ29326.1 MAG: sodium-translocating pyrophosphatase [Deltaproteobacteria bacterium RIFCSPHIGHO2_12_FULL_44_21]OGQ32703.1 MAG: sodium-translocating pyrophosphatase [Deltaproteobacteria bacterium RIFCSPLOWO2_01_FULL_45_74]OGQ41805.1 MAG: sodium-translocating pyrophosphatase [Deltaprote
MIKKFCLALLGILLIPQLSLAAGEASLQLPELTSQYLLFGKTVLGKDLMYGGLGICILGMLFGLFEYIKVKRLPAHKLMLEVSNIIYETCKTYLFQQGKLLIVLELFIGSCIFYYFFALQHMPLQRVLLILGWSVVGILGSFSVAWFGIRINTLANSRTAFASLRGKPYWVSKIPLRAGMSIGVLLICIELIMMLSILLFVDPSAAGSCFIGFAIGESLGASALRICGGIFTKIADIGSDLMKIVFNIKEDDARNPGVIADCTGDNAGDSVGPTADGFETYGVTGVALITFIVLAVIPQFKSDFIIWIFTMRVLMILTSIGSYTLNSVITAARLKEKDKFNFEAPLTELVWLTSLISIGVTFAVSYLLLHANYGNLWLTLSIIISCGTLAAAVIPELTKVFTSCHSKHVQEIVNAGKEGGASLVILSGLIAGNFSCFWKGISIIGLMFVAYTASQHGLDLYMGYPTVFAFGLVAFGLLGMGPVTIAVDSYGPVTDNAQSIFELSLIEQAPNISQEIEKDFGFKPDFVKGKHFLEENDGAGNTFKATAKPVLIATAVIGATTMIFSLILLLKEHFHWEKIGAELSIIDPHVLLGIICGGSVIYWFTGASMQAVTTGAYRAVEYIKKNIRLEGSTKASIHDSKEVVKICTQYAQAGMVNIFGVIFCFTLAFACFSPTFFVGYLISIAVFGLFQAIFMANGGGAWDNAKKLVEVEMKEKGTALHTAMVVGDTVGDPFKDTSSVALNPIIKFTTLFGLLAVEIAISDGAAPYVRWVGAVFFLIGTFFVWRSFYGMRIKANTSTNSVTSHAHAAKQLV